VACLTPKCPESYVRSLRVSASQWHRNLDIHDHRRASPPQNLIVQMIEIMEEIRNICKAIVVCDSISASRPKQDMQFFLICYVKALARIVVHSLCAAVEIVCGV